MSAAAKDVLVQAIGAKVILMTVHQGTDEITIADIEDHQIVVIMTMVAEALKDGTMTVVEETEGLEAVTVVIEAVSTKNQLFVEAEEMIVATVTEEMIVATVTEAPMKRVMITRRDPHHPKEVENTVLIK